MNSMLDMVIIPEGSFLMGADPEVEINAEYEEQPQREVWLSTYAIQRTPVTVGQWQEFLRDTGYVKYFSSYLLPLLIVYPNKEN
ncbi:formylglycine-generating enzyme family protein [Nostoc sp.]|uniref:formylglycine-generating enzyme family protein n=1 Tax=Nostoc sp. TaxID=1180 RepID=UPI002FF97774